MLSDPIADMLVRIKNGYMARKNEVLVPYSKMRFELAKIMAKLGYVAKVEVKGEHLPKRLLLSLVYKNNNPGLIGVRRISRPGRRVYVGVKKIPWVLSGLGVAIISTSKGLMDDRQARKQGLGGEVVCEFW